MLELALMIVIININIVGSAWKPVAPGKECGLPLVGSGSGHLHEDGA